MIGYLQNNIQLVKEQKNENWKIEVLKIALSAVKLLPKAVRHDRHLNPQLCLRLPAEPRYRLIQGGTTQRFPQ